MNRKSLQKTIGNTPIRAYNGDVPNNNRIHIKLESNNPFGSHYDRVYLALFEHFENHPEERFRIKSGDKTLETSSGSAGISFGGVGRILGYHCTAVIPEQLEKTRKQAVASSVDELIEISGDYVNEFPAWIRKNLRTLKGYGGEMAFLNHSMGPKDEQTGLPTENYVTTNALASIATEALKQLNNIDYFIPAIGNGSSIVGPARVFKELSSNTKLIGYETLQSAAGFELKYPGVYKSLLGIDPGTLQTHSLPGTSYNGIDFPHLRIAAKEQLDEIVLVTDQQMNANYQEKTKKELPLFLNFVRWDEIDYQDLGRSSRAGLLVALEKAKTVENKDFLIIGYDTKKRYDS